MSNRQRTDKPQFSLGWEDEKCDQTTAPVASKQFAEKRNVIQSLDNQSNFLAPNNEILGQQANLHRDADDYARQVDQQSTTQQEQKPKSNIR